MKFGEQFCHRMVIASSGRSHDIVEVSITGSRRRAICSIVHFAGCSQRSGHQTAGAVDAS